MEVSGQLHAQTATSSGKDPPGSRWKGDWVGPKANVNAVVKRKVSRYVKK
jgi:hypothetical protein